MFDLIDDLSKITTIPQDALTKLVDKVNWCICEYINETDLGKEQTLDIDIGIGKLCILIGDNLVKYKFIQSSKLEKSVRDVIINESNPLKDRLEKRLVDKITETYKDLI